MPRCECPERSVEFTPDDGTAHEPGECPATNTFRVVRGIYPDSRIINVCNDCTFTGDRRLDVPQAP